MNGIEFIPCPFCGQAQMCEPGMAPESVCKCDDARKYQNLQNVYKARVKALNKLCGDYCGEVYPDFQPVGDETLAQLREIVHSVVFNKMKKVTIVLSDDTQLKITQDGIERKLVVNAKQTG